MNTRTATLKELVDTSSYPFDERAIAQAILVRSMARRLVPELAFRLPQRKPQVRSFRPHRGARSFRLARPERRPASGQMSATGSPHAVALH